MMLGGQQRPKSEGCNSGSMCFWVVKLADNAGMMNSKIWWYSCIWAPLPLCLFFISVFYHLVHIRRWISNPLYIRRVFFISRYLMVFHVSLWSVSYWGQILLSFEVRKALTMRRLNDAKLRRRRVIHPGATRYHVEKWVRKSNTPEF